MTLTPFLSSLSSAGIATLIRQARKRIILAVPGIHMEVANALVERRQCLQEGQITVTVDFSESVLRMGYGSLEAYQRLTSANVKVTQSGGLRSGILIVDGRGWVFTPTALCLENEPQSIETPNAVRLTREQVRELEMRLSPEARQEAIADVKSRKRVDANSGGRDETLLEEEIQRLESIQVEISTEPIPEKLERETTASIESRPPTNFDLERQVRVFSPYLQYVEIELIGAAIGKKTVKIPKALADLGNSDDMKGKIKSTFDLVEADSELCQKSKELAYKLRILREEMAPFLGKKHGRVIMKSKKPIFLGKIEELKENLENYQSELQSGLQSEISKGYEEITNHYLPLVTSNPPSALTSGIFESSVTEQSARRWLKNQLKPCFPKIENLMRKMSLEVVFKDVTHETLKDADFFEELKKAFPYQDWDKPMEEFVAAREGDE